MCILYVNSENLYLSSFLWLIMLQYAVTWHISHFKCILIFYKVLFIVLIKLSENMKDDMTCGCITPGINNTHSNNSRFYTGQQAANLAVFFAARSADVDRGL